MLQCAYFINIFFLYLFLLDLARFSSPLTCLHKLGLYRNNSSTLFGGGQVCAHLNPPFTRLWCYLVSAFLLSGIPLYPIQMLKVTLIWWSRYAYYHCFAFFILCILCMYMSWFFPGLSWRENVSAFRKIKARWYRWSKRVSHLLKANTRPATESCIYIKNWWMYTRSSIAYTLTCSLLSCFFWFMFHKLAVFIETTSLPLPDPRIYKVCLVLILVFTCNWWSGYHIQPHW